MAENAPTERLLENRIGTTPLFGAPVLGDSVGISQSGLLWENYRMMGLPGDDKSLIVSLSVSIQYTNVTDRQTDTGRQQRPYA